MSINNRLLGIGAMAGAPFLAIEMLSGKVAAQQAPQVTTGWAAIFDIIYMLGWMCSIYALLKSGASGAYKWGNAVLKIQLSLLAMANVYNAWGATGLGTDTMLFRAMDLSWPLSNLCMLATGIAIIKGEVLQGWKKYVPLAAGLWLPVALLPMSVLGRTPGTFYFGLAYSAIVWTAMGLAVYHTREEKLVYNQFGYPEIVA